MPGEIATAIIATSAGPKGQHAPPEPVILHSPSSARQSVSSPRPALHLPHRPRARATIRRSPIKHARASAPADTTAPPAPARGFLSIRLAVDEAPLRACAQRSSVVPAPGLRLALVLWKAWTGCARPRFPQDQQKQQTISRKLSFMRAIPSRFQWTMWCPKKPGPAVLRSHRAIYLRDFDNASIGSDLLSDHLD